MTAAGKLLQASQFTTPSMQYSHAERIIEEGYDLVPFIPPHGLIEKVMIGWNRFLELPFEERIKWRVGDPCDYDDGFVPREKKPGDPSQGTAIRQDGKVYDNKNFFHYRPHLYALLNHTGVDYREYMGWLTALDSLWKFCSVRFHTVLEQLDSVLPQYGFAERSRQPDMMCEHVVRLLSYNEEMIPGNPLAKEHRDRNFGTFQVYESDPALQIQNRDGEMIPYVAVRNQALFFTGLKAAALTQGKLRAVKHNIVVPQDFVPDGSNKPRQSIVFFGHVYKETLI